MSQTCTVCRHEDRAAIDQALVGGKPYRYVSDRFDLSLGAVQRHRADHVPATLARAKEAEEVAQADDLLQEARALRAKAYSILLRAEREGDLRTALAGIREARGCLELMAELEGRLSRQPVNIILLPEWQALRAALLAALAPFPEARAAAAAALTNGHTDD